MMEGSEEQVQVKIGIFRDGLKEAGEKGGEMQPRLPPRTKSFCEQSGDRGRAGERGRGEEEKREKKKWSRDVTSEAC